MDAYIVIGVMILMIVAFVMNKWPFGLITMSCCIILGVTGVLDASGTFAGFCNPFVVMLAGSFVVTNALAKTSFISNVQKRIIQLQNGKSGFRPDGNLCDRDHCVVNIHAGTGNACNYHCNGEKLK